MCPCQKIFFTVGVLFGLLAFAAGAFGSHILRERFSLSHLNVFEIGVRYQMYHALALMILAWASSYFSSPLIPLAGWLFIIGTPIFSGSLYGLVILQIRGLGIVTPIGGVILLIGWLMLVIGGVISK